MSGDRADAEVVVVGAGPGGSLAAAALARAGRTVVLLEAARFPRDKVCGDVLLPEVDGLLRRVGATIERIAPEARVLEGCRYEGASGRRVEGRFADATGRVRPWWILPRRRLDSRLARWAEHCGAELRQSHRVTGIEWRPERGINRLSVAAPGGTVALNAPVVIGADGAGSRVARERGLASGGGLDPGLCVGLRGYVDWPDDRRATIFADRDLVPGCAWIVPQPGGRANIGLGLVETDRRRRGLLLKQRFERLVADIAPGRQVEALAGWQLPTGGRGRRAAGDGVLLVGDAARLIDPFTGHGIHVAMASGLIAAGVAARALRRAVFTVADGPLGEYEGLLRRDLGLELRLGDLLQRFHARPALVELALRRAGASRRWADRFIGLAGHAIPKRQLLGPSFWLDLVRPPGRWPDAEAAPGVPLDAG